MTNKYLIAQSSDQLSEERLETMIQYANFTGCLRNYILQYFGENVFKPCENCSSCLGEVEIVDVTREAQMILSSMVRMKHHFGMTMIVDVLRGSQNQRVLENKFNKISTYGLMKSYSVQQIRDIISALAAHRYIDVTEYRGLRVASPAKSLLVGETSLAIKERSYKEIASSKTRPVSSHIDHDLFEELREVRKLLAQAEGVPAYIIFSNKSLEDMVSKLPKDEDEFLSVEGVGPVKADKYAGQFLPVIQKALSEKKKKLESNNFEPQNGQFNVYTSTTSSHLESAKYAEQGLTPYEIAIERGLTETTILNHLTQAAGEGELEDFEADVPHSRKELIKEAFQKVGTDAMKPVKEFLADEITYDEIRYVLIEYIVKG